MQICVEKKVREYILCDFCHVKMKWAKQINGDRSQNDVCFSEDNTWDGPEAGSLLESC